jgi:hypothetical protein
MDVAGIWRYWGNYSFFGAPFIWTTLHNMGGNDGMKGDMRLLSGFPGDATAAGASISGVGATPEGIDQVQGIESHTHDAFLGSGSLVPIGGQDTYTNRIPLPLLPPLSTIILTTLESPVLRICV